VEHEQGESELPGTGVSRREVLAALVAAPAALHAGIAMASSDERASASGAAGKRTMAPLPFDPKKLAGLSERMISSHWENNYGGALKNLLKVEDELGRVNKDTPGYLVGALKERELTYSNSVVLHELYFGNLGGNGKADGAISKGLADTFGGFGRFEELFRATGASLGGSSGWTTLDLNFHSKDLRIYWSANHTQSPAFAQPLLVLDMYEHSYQMDYGAAAAKYIDAFFQNINWDEVNRRYERGLKATKALGS
jgi:superoxide dismutase, Fe-Mn family